MLDSLITLKVDNSSGANIAFDATIDSQKQVITINPNSNLTGQQNVYVAIGATVEDQTCGKAITAANATFTVVDTNVPTLTSSTPADGATEVGVNDNIVLNFSKLLMRRVVILLFINLQMTLKWNLYLLVTLKYLDQVLQQ